MVRGFVRFRGLAAGGLLLWALAGCALAQPVRTAPTRPAEAKPWATTRIGDSPCVSSTDLAARLGLKAVWDKKEPQLTLTTAAGRVLLLERDRRDVYLDGVRIMLSEPVLFQRDQAWVALPDVTKTLVPLLRPVDWLPQLPPAAPKTIVLDPGHGGTDPGKQNARLKLDEKDMALDVALRVRKLLEARGHQVIMTRSTDKRFSNNPAVDLPMRADVANKAGADLFVSIHFNAVDPQIAQRVSGSETYVLTPQHMESTEPERDRSMLPVANPGNRHDPANVLLGYEMHRAVLGALKTSDRGFKRARFAVLRPLKCPGVLVEAAYLSNDTEARRVGTPAYRQQIAEAIADGIRGYGEALTALRQPR